MSARLTMAAITAARVRPANAIPRLNVVDAKTARRLAYLALQAALEAPEKQGISSASAQVDWQLIHEIRNVAGEAYAAARAELKNMSADR